MSGSMLNFYVSGRFPELNDFTDYDLLDMTTDALITLSKRGGLDLLTVITEFFYAIEHTYAVEYAREEFKDQLDVNLN